MQHRLKRRAGEVAREMFPVLFEPAPYVIENHCCAVKDQRENRRTREAGLATAHPLEKREDARYVRHQEGQPEKGDEVEGDEPAGN